MKKTPSTSQAPTGITASSGLNKSKKPISNSQAPTGRNIPAQGKEPRDAALGPPPPQNPSPEGARYLPVSWVMCRFVEVANVISGKNQKKVESSSGVYPIYGSGGTFGRATAYLCEAGTTVIGRKGTINSPIFVNERFWNVDTAFGLFPIDAELLTTRFLYYFCCLFDFSALDKSTTIPSLAKRDINAIPLPLPPLAEQKRIVAKIEELFSELDAGEESFRKARQQLSLYRQSLLKQAFEGKLTADWRARHPDQLESPNQLLARIQEEREARYEKLLTEWEAAVKKWELGTQDEKKPSRPKRPNLAKEVSSGEDRPLFTLPDCWTWLRFDLACYESVLGKMLDAAKNRGELKPYLRNISVRWGNFNLDNLLLIRIEDTEIDRYKAVAGDLIICEGGEPGRCAVWPANQGREVFLQKALHRVRFTSSVSPYFVEYLMSLLASTKRLEKHFTGTTIKHLTGAGLAGVPVPICSLPEQQEIVRILDEQFTVIEQNEREIDAALKRSEALRQSILKKAFSGQLVPQDPTDEPASILLNRIRAEREADAQRGRKVLAKRIKD